MNKWTPFVIGIIILFGIIFIVDWDGEDDIEEQCENLLEEDCINVANCNPQYIGPDVEGGSSSYDGCVGDPEYFCENTGGIWKVIERELMSDNYECECPSDEIFFWETTDVIVIGCHSCDELVNPEDIDEYGCYLAVAEKKNDSSYCENLDKKSLRDGCYLKMQ